MQERYGILVSDKSAKKIDRYLEKYGEYEAYNMFGERDDSIEIGIQKMVWFYKQHPKAPV